MKKLNKVAMLFASAALAAPLTVFAQAKPVDNWRSGTGQDWKSGTGNCWRDASWTPATASAECDGALKPPAPAPAPAPRVAPPPPPPPPPPPAAPAARPRRRPLR